MEDRNKTRKQLVDELQMLRRRIAELQASETELKRVEEALRESERRSRALFDQTYQFIGLLTPDGVLVEANRTAMEFAGIKASEVLGKPFWETAWWRHSEELRERLRQAIKDAAKGKFMRFEVTASAADGSLHCLDFSLKPIKDDAGNIVFLLPEGRDITIRKQMEESLRESEARARVLLNAPTESAVLIAPDHTIRAANKMAAKFLSTTVDQLIGKSIFDFLPPELGESRKPMAYQVFDSGKSHRFDDSYKGKFYSHNIYPVLDAQGKVTQVAIYTRDVTDFKLTQASVEQRTAELLESEEKYRTLVENLPLVVYRMGSDGKIVFINSFVEEIFGYSLTEIFKYPELWTELIYNKDRVRVEKLRCESFREGKEFLAEYRVKHKNGHIVYVADHGIPVKDFHDVISYVDGIIMDVTGRIKRQEELVRAEELKTISEVSARLAHEIRNPLVSVGGFARRLLSSLSKDDPNRAKVEIIVKEAGRLETILRMVLNYIQPLELHMSPTDPTQLIERVLDALDTEFKERELKVHLQLDPEIPELTVDAMQMELALETLAKQALNQTEEGATLFISTHRENDMFKLTIRYPVRHISPDDVEHFFYPFTTSQMGCETADLPMSKIVIDKHGGTINVFLEKRCRLVINITLPI